MDFLPFFAAAVDFSQWKPKEIRCLPYFLEGYGGSLRNMLNLIVEYEICHAQIFSQVWTLNLSRFLNPVLNI